MENSVVFDPDRLSIEQKSFLIKKLEEIAGPPDPDGCRKFLRKSRKMGIYGVTKTRSDISVLFGDSERNYNPASLAYSMEFSQKLLKGQDIECSHLCGYGLCMTPSHVVMEDHLKNIERRNHHAYKFCSGHGDCKPCILKTVVPSYSFHE